MYGCDGEGKMNAPGFSRLEIRQVEHRIVFVDDDSVFGATQPHIGRKSY